jgi:hypothetical protein
MVNVNRVVLDSNGLKVSKATFNVLNETDINNFIFKATENIGAGVFMSGSITGVTSSTISFGTTFSYIPFTLVTTKVSSGSSGSGVFTGGLVNRFFTGTVSNSNLVFSTLLSTSTYYYAIFYMKAR